MIFVFNCDIEIEDLYQLFVIDTIMAETKYSNKQLKPSYELTCHLIHDSQQLLIN